MPINFKIIKTRVKKIKSETPKLIAIEAVKHFKKSFRDGGFTDDRFSPWAKIKRPNRADKRTKKRRAILVDSGDLRKSIKRRKASFRTIVVGSYGLNYGKFHNRGTGGQTKRQFIGESHKLNLSIRLILHKRFKQALKK
jgi:phage gpG-like protein